MKLVLESKDSLTITKLPNVISGNYWVVDENNKNLLNVDGNDNKWILSSNTDIKISNSLVNDSLSNINYIDKVELEENKYYYVTNIMTKEQYVIYTLPSYENFINFIVDYNQNSSIVIGKNSDININNQLFIDKDISIEYDKKLNSIVFKNLNNKTRSFVNYNVCDSCNLSSGDIIFKNGIFIYYFGSLLLVSDDKNDIMFNSLKLNKRLIKENEKKDYSNLVDKDIKVFSSNDFYQRPPRFKRKIENKVFNIDSPTQKENDEETPLIFTVAPMMTMGMMSLVTGVNSLNKVLNGDSTFKDEMGSLIMCICMLLSMIVFPLAQRFYNKIKKAKKERKRRRKYKKYIDKKREEIFTEINYQKQVLIEDNLPIENVRNIILSKSRNLWERKLEHDDFLNLRFGVGNVKPSIEIKYPENHFTMEEDDLKDIIDDLVNESKDIIDVPITINLRNNNKTGIISDDNNLYNMFDNLMLQIMAYHGYDMLRIVILTNNNHYWEKYMNIPYLWNDDKSIRYYASNKEDINKVTSYLMEEYNYRKEVYEDNMSFKPYYLVITDDVNSVKNNIFINEILKSNINLGYSLLMGVNKLDVLPNECSLFINLSNEVSGIFTNQMTLDNQVSFKKDNVNFGLTRVIEMISNIPMDINNGKFVLPKKYGFLEMYDVGNVNQLNIINRWKNNDVIHSLSCPVGIDEQGELFNIDLHEKAHGPHGLVAGMTGSGKSEWIITYILSMAINYSPEEVQFVLIDYKGGGLALTFDNRENNIKLPHVVGTITNLDIVEIKRSLASIESELKRRQAMFKKAREILNESSMDIYKYQDYYRQGKLSEPMSHLFIISDEFAELKVQQPEFMDKLISTARIGRSLGVHLILATQKPSGVVDDQIWSNSKFRVCLKVQDKSDSNDMIKCPDAAMIKETGRFFLQVGYNELFMKGQSAYAGMPYYESDKKITVVNSSIDFVDEIGSIIKRGDVKKNNTQYVHKGEELPNVLNYIIDTFKKENLNVKSLWLSSIPKVIYVDKLKEKYNYVKEDYILNPVIGEYDYPSKQIQGLLTLELSKEGNTIIYGSSGSGKENLLTTILYSLISNYSVYEVNSYILDFGSGVLNNFKLAPHIGDIIHSGDDEKINNLFSFVEDEIKRRKKLFESSSGTYLNYIKSNTKKCPNIVIIINSFEVFNDLYEIYYNKVIELTRDCVRYGIYFIITSQAANNVKLKLTQNFKNNVCLQMTDEYDYTAVLGKTNGILPSKIVGRGLVKLDSIVEFQTAYPFEIDNMYEKISKWCLDLNISSAVYSAKIKVLPDIVTYSDLIERNKKYGLPCGISKKTLNVKYIDIDNNLGYLISSNSVDDIFNFIDNELYILNNSEMYSTAVIDMKYLYEDNKYNNILYYNSNYSDILEKIDNYFTQIYDILKNNNFQKQSIANVKTFILIIVGIEKFFKNLKDEDKKLFDNIVNYVKDCYKLKILIIDSPGEIKKIEYESWYKDLINSNTGLWIGNGFTDQSVIRPYKYSSNDSKEIKNNFAYIVENGQSDLIKIIQDKK